MDLAQAIDRVTDYAICNVVPKRANQLEREGKWMMGKCFPTFGPFSPWRVTPGAVPDPQTLGLWMKANGKRLKHTSTRTMIFPIRHLSPTSAD